ncbi:ABC transporter ATP-binding protein [Streptomyces solisilvae]|uniref:ABC transporter ATP-binding protein n=1 Tax=Streptomyces malaysiensis TaxID=92644 RepID=UPI0036744A52
MSAALDVEGLCAWYGSAQVLFDVALDVQPGEMVGLLGRNGAGKTTTLKCVMGIDAHRSGAVRFEGEDVAGLRTESLARAGIAWVPPDRRIFTGLTVLENLQLAARARQVRLDLDLLVDNLPILGRLLDRRGYALSGGEQQAVAVARALAGRPRVLLLDEPTEGLSPLVVEELRTAFVQLPSAFGIAVLLAEQNLQFVLSLASRVAVLETGRVAYRGSATEFAESPDLQHRYLSVSSERSRLD